MDLSDLEWGDVLFDADGVVVCDARLGDEQVLAKRWQGDVLDAERTARTLLEAAGVPGLELFGSGPGWLVVEAMGQSMWRSASPADLAQLDVARGLADWFAACHQVAPAGLAGEGDELQEVVGLLGGVVEQSVADELAARVTGWSSVLAARPRVLAVGGLRADEVAVMGARAMPTELSRAVAGPPEVDLATVAQELGEDPWQAFRERYQQQGGSIDDAALAARHGIDLAWQLVALALSGEAVDEVVAAIRRCG